MKFPRKVFFTAVTSTLTKSTVGREGFILAHSSQSIVEERQDQRPWRLLWLPYTIQDSLPRGGTTQSGLVPPTSTVNQENALVAMTTDSLLEAILRLRFPLPGELTTEISDHTVA